jgi:phosphoglycerol transferase MdoB-like AlkP superfamily enzyme
MDGPKYVFAHVVSPHPPFVFDQSGQPIDSQRSYNIGDGDDYQGDLDEYLVGYSGQVQFINHEMEQVIDAILANSSSPPIIIIQGDHGPGSRLD